MSSQKAKELRALALSLSLVNDDLKQKRYLRKSEFYKESDRYKMERRAQQLAAMNLSNELKSVSPAVAGVLINAVNNAPAEVVGHAGDEEIKEGDLKKITGATIGEILKKETIRKEAVSMTQKNIEEAIKNLKKTPDERASAKRERGLSDKIFSEIIDRKIDDVYKNFDNAVDISPEQLQRANRKQLMKLKRRYQEIDEDDAPTSAVAGKIINQHLTIIENRLGLMKRQEKAEAELKSRAERKIAKPTKPKLKREPTPPVGPPPLSIAKKRGRGRPKSKEVEERKQMAKEDKPPKPRGRPRKKPVEQEPIVSQRQADKKLEEMLKAQAQELRKPRFAEAAGPKSTTLEGDGFKDYLAYMKGRKPTKKMKKLILLIGSQRAGNNSHKLKIEIEKLMHDIKHDLEDKIRKHKSKSVRKQASSVAMEKKKLLIREAAKKQMAYEKSLAQY